MQRVPLYQKFKEYNLRHPMQQQLHYQPINFGYLQAYPAFYPFSWYPGYKAQELEIGQATLCSSNIAPKKKGNGGLNSRRQSNTLRLFRNKEIKPNFKDFKRNIVEFCTDPSGSRFVQLIFDNKDRDDSLYRKEEVELLQQEVMKNSFALMKHFFGNYVIQNLLDTGTRVQRALLASTLHNKMQDLSVHPQAKHRRHEEPAYLGYDPEKVQSGTADLHLARPLLKLVESHVAKRIAKYSLDPNACRLVQRIIHDCKAKESKELNSILTYLEENIAKLAYNQHVVKMAEEISHKTLQSGNSAGSQWVFQGSLKAVQFEETKQSGHGGTTSHFGSRKGGMLRNTPVSSVILTIKRGNSYDNVFREVKQQAVDGNGRVSVYEVQPGQEVFRLIIDTFRDQRCFISYDPNIPEHYTFIPEDFHGAVLPRNYSSVSENGNNFSGNLSHESNLDPVGPSGTISVGRHDRHALGTDGNIHMPAGETSFGGSIGLMTSAVHLGGTRERAKAQVDFSNHFNKTGANMAKRGSASRMENEHTSGRIQKTSFFSKSLNTIRGKIRGSVTDQSDANMSSDSSRSNRLTVEEWRELEKMEIPPGLEFTQDLGIETLESFFADSLWEEIMMHLNEKFVTKIEIGKNSRLAMQYMRLNFSPKLWKMVKQLLEIETLARDIRECGFEAVSINFECCSGFSMSGFGFYGNMPVHNMFLEFVRFMVYETQVTLLFSDFSLSALICAWEETQEPALLRSLGRCPFTLVAEFSESFKLVFDCQTLKECPSAQLQLVGEICEHQEEEEEVELFESGYTPRHLSVLSSKGRAGSTPSGISTSMVDKIIEKRKEVSMDMIDAWGGDALGVPIKKEKTRSLFGRTMLRPKSSAPLSSHESFGTRTTEVTLRPRFETFESKVFAEQDEPSLSKLTRVNFFQGQANEDEVPGLGKALFKTKEKTKAFVLNNFGKDASKYGAIAPHIPFNVEVLTVSNYLESSSVTEKIFHEIQQVEDLHFGEVDGFKGVVGHALLTYPGGGRILASMGHWSSVANITTTSDALLRRLKSVGEEENEVYRRLQTDLQHATRPHESLAVTQRYAREIVQSAPPASRKFPKGFI
eukprot:augustus_masked-scaffold_36-processed-gene-1.10-mRNA-1 protein AED:1.00 eAED:1.00 QI:0/0/0/0/1/1/3/0/1094